MTYGNGRGSWLQRAGVERGEERLKRTGHATGRN